MLCPTGQYSQILGSIWEIFCCSDTQYNTNPRAVSTVHIPVNNYLVPLVTLTDAIVCLDITMICCCLLNTIIVIIIEFWDFSWYWVMGIGIIRGQLGLWVLDIGCLSWYHSNPNHHKYLYNYRIYSRISRKIYDQILIKK